MVDNVLNEVRGSGLDPRLRIEEAKADLEEPSIRLGCHSQKLADLVVGADANGEGKVDRAAIFVVGIVTTEVIVLIRKAEGAYRSFFNENNEVLDECKVTTGIAPSLNVAQVSSEFS